MLVRFLNVTSAIKIKKLLGNKGIKSDIVRTPFKMEGEGCGFSLKIKKEYMDIMEKTACDEGIVIKGVYDETLGIW